MTEVQNAKDAFLKIMKEILSYQVSGGMADFYGADLNLKNVYGKNGFIIVKCFGEENQLIAAYFGAVDSFGKFKVKIPNQI